MNLLSPPRCFDANSPELIDRPGIDQALLWEELKVLESANRRFGGHRLILDFIRQFLCATQDTSLRILDLATGGADIPRSIAAWFRERHWPVTITAVDRNPEILKYARESCRDWPEIYLEQHDLQALPYASESYDLVLCSLALHHFSAADAVGILRRMQEIARVGYIVSDLRRNCVAIWITKVLARTLIRSHMMRHDALQSCRAAFTPGELRRMAQQAGLEHFQIARRQGVFHMVLAGWKVNLAG
jgi:2-polyprenyl-3-methyl-5-hydroxy-6-metoxy-1,4-benzoquinol methylase